MTLMVAYYLTFVIMLTFLDHSRIWYDGVFFLSINTVLVMQKGLAMTLIFGQIDTRYIFSGNVGDKLCGRLYYKIKTCLRWRSIKDFAQEYYSYATWAILNEIRLNDIKTIGGRVGGGGMDCCNPHLMIGHCVCPGMY